MTKRDKDQFDSFLEYLKDIDISSRPLLDRCRLFHSLCSQMTDESIQDVFVSDYFDSEGNRQYDSFWCFTKHYALEAKNFLKELSLDITPIWKSITYWAMTAKEYDFSSAANPNSRLTVKFEANVYSGDFKAARNNCDYLIEKVVKKYLKPNLWYFDSE